MSNGAQQPVTKDAFLATLRNALKNLIQLKVVTEVNGKRMTSTIDLLSGDITSSIAPEFIGDGPYSSLRGYHAEREKQGLATIEANIKAVERLASLAKDLFD